jgi:hypothetical protein
MRGLDVLFEPDLARVESMPPVLAGAIELVSISRSSRAARSKRSSNGAGMV